MRVQRVCVLGSTGSIGVNTLDVMARHPERYQVFALTAATQVDMLEAQCLRWQPRFAVMPDPALSQVLAQRLKAQGLSTQVLTGVQALAEVAAHPEVDSVMAAIVGAAGLPACMAAARAGKKLMLANKEALVVGGALFMAAVQEGGATLLPIDSEHSAVFQCLPAEAQTWPEQIEKIILTASGGPFRARPLESFAQITPAQACAHPNWVMGKKISVDSATMMNKALEVIEAKWLFHLQPERIEVVIHPQSIVHSMVVFKDASVLAQMGTPDMRVPIAYGLSWPKRLASGAPALDILGMGALTFEAVDAHRFPGLKLAWQVLNAREGTAAVLNAANEVAVEAFLHERIRFDQIHQINQETLANVSVTLADTASLSDVLNLDARARQAAGQEVTQIGSR